MLFKRRRGKEEELEEKRGWYKLLVSLIISMTSTSLLKWWEALLVLATGVMFGIGVGIVIAGRLIVKETTIVIPLNETHIIRVKP